MLPSSAKVEPGGGRLAENVVHFARVLRRAGLPVGTDRALLALQALEVAGLESRADLHHVLQACLIDRVEHRVLFDQAFQIFWRDPDLLQEALRLLLPWTGVPPARKPPPPNRRLTEALFERAPSQPEAPSSSRDPIALDAELSWSDRERLRKQDFETMSTAEWDAARRAVSALEPLFARLRTRRDAPSARGHRLDLRQLLRDSARHGGDVAFLPRLKRRTRIEPIVVIVDISGSMSRYSRMFLHFVHALANGSQACGLRVSAFVFGTRLTNITRAIRARDPDESVARVVDQVSDWSGGTRIGTCLKEFNKAWARRLPLARATILLVTDGLEHAGLDVLASETERLARSCRRILWLNPLLRYDRFEPKAGGIRAMLPHVDRLLPVHNIHSLEQLTRVLSTLHTPELPPWK